MKLNDIVIFNGRAFQVTLADESGFGLTELYVGFSDESYVSFADAAHFRIIGRVG